VQGQALAEGARSAFIHGMGDAVLLGAGIAALGALLVLLFLPSRAGARAEAPQEVETAPRRRVEARRCATQPLGQPEAAIDGSSRGAVDDVLER
jgi:hypothetical protein